MTTAIKKKATASKVKRQAPATPPAPPTSGRPANPAFDALVAIVGIPLVASEWHQQLNGGGWVYKNASVAADVFVGAKAIVWGGTIWGGTIEGGTIWGGTIRGGTIEGGTIRGGTIEGGTIWGGTIMGGTIEGGTIRGGTIRGGTIEGGEWLKTPLFITGSRHSLSNAKPGHLRVGCKCEPFAWWLTLEGEDFGRSNGYTDAEILEYRAYVKLFVEVGQ